MKFADILGHEKTKRELRAMVETDRIPHALLLSGVSGLGKMRLVRAFLQYIYCSNRHDGEPCGLCPACLQTESFNNPDIHWVFPFAHNQNCKAKFCTDLYPQWKEMMTGHPYMEPEQWAEIISAGNSQPVIYRDEAASLLANAMLSSLTYRYKTYVIWLPEKMNQEAGNALLKVIEEPYEDTLFIMVSNAPGEMLPTIFSRVQRLNLNPIDEQSIRDWLVNAHAVPPLEAAEAARLAEGRPGRGLELAEHCGEQEEFGDIYRQMMRRAYTREVAGLKELSEEVAAMGREKNIRFLDYCSRMARENFICNFAIPPLNALNSQEQVFSTRFAPFVNYRNIEALARETDLARRDISRNANAKIVMFDYMLSLCAIIRVMSKGGKSG